MPYYAGDYYAGDPQLAALVKAGGAALAKTGIGAKVGSALAKLGASKVGAAAKSALAFGAAGAAMEAGSRLAAKGIGPADEGERRRYRRMNVLNPRALRRSMRRVQGFARFARKTMSFVHHHKLKKKRRR